jgi:hypothetical protein
MRQSVMQASNLPMIGSIDASRTQSRLAAKLTLCRMDGANRSNASPRNRLASDNQCGTSVDSGHASAFSMWVNAWTNSEVTA